MRTSNKAVRKTAIQLHYKKGGQCVMKRAETALPYKVSADTRVSQWATVEASDRLTVLACLTADQSDASYSGAYGQLQSGFVFCTLTNKCCCCCCVWLMIYDVSHTTLPPPPISPRREIRLSRPNESASRGSWKSGNKTLV